MEEFREQSKQMGKKLKKVTDNLFKSKEGNDVFFEKRSGGEYEDLKKNKLEDPADELFREINPTGIFIGDIKKKLEKEVVDGKALIEKLSPNLNKDLINKTKKEIIGKNWWIMKIDDYLLDKNIEDLRKTNPSLN